MSKIKVITSLNEDLWKEYADKSIQSWVENMQLDQGSEIEIWIAGAFPRNLPTKTFNGTPIKYKMMDTQSEGWRYFYETFAQHPRPNTPPGQEYRFKFLPFSVKVYAQAEAALESKTTENYPFDYHVWLDADVFLTKPVTTSFLLSTIGDADIAWLDRGRPWGHGETGFVMTKTVEDCMDLFLNQANIYGSGQLFYFAEWHDAFIFTSLIRMLVFMNPGIKVVNLNKDMESKNINGLYPFTTSVLHEYMRHHKGELKKQIQKTYEKTFAEAVFN